MKALTQIKKLLNDNNLDAYIIPKNDEFFTEYSKINKLESGLFLKLFPHTMDEIIQIADLGETMPPKSTWIEPKLRSGVTIYEY